MTNCKSPNCLSKISNFISKQLETIFARYGNSVASHPILYISGCILITGLACIGFMNFYEESRSERLWIPQDSDYVQNIEWQQINFPKDRRSEFVLFESQENILTADNILQMYEHHTIVNNISVIDNYGVERSYTDLCLQIPVRVTTGSMQCLEVTILQLWEDSYDVIINLSDDDVIKAINERNVSKWYGTEVDFISLLGEVQRDAITGQVTSSKTVLHQWVMKINKTEIDQGNIVDDSGAAEEVDRALYDWEESFIKYFQDEQDLGGDEELTIYILAARSFADIAGDTILGDVLYIIIGTMMLFIFVLITLGKFNLVETRPILSLCGFLACFMAIAICIGLSSAFGLAYGPVHSILPLLLIGIGVDDMFVIVQSWENIPPEEQLGNVATRMSKALKHAGVAITVTSMTDFLAFIIGSATALPALQSFCIYCAIGITALYILQATFFVAWFSLDQQRLEKRKNGLFWCYQHKNWTPSLWSRGSLSQLFFKKYYAPLLLKKPIKLIVLIVTSVLFGTSVWGVTTLRQEFDPTWFLPHSSYVYQYISELNKYYPSQGVTGTVYLGALDYPQEVSKIRTMTQHMTQDATARVTYIDSWYDKFCDYTTTYECGDALSDQNFDTFMSDFLFSSEGAQYITYFNFDGNLTYGQPVPKILASKIPYTHDLINDTNDQISAMDLIKTIVQNQHFSDYAAPISEAYSNWETDKIISLELVRNLLCSMLAVLLMTLLLIANVMTSFYVLLCVALTLVNVMALMSWWNLTIDTVSCINLVVSIGLCVDYSAHIGLHFMRVAGSRDDRAHRTLVEIGPAVISGAFSTFLAFIVLAGSESHVFITFFRIFFGVFIFGVYNGLVFLPVVLSIIGPDCYSWISEEAEAEVEEQRDKSKTQLPRASIKSNQLDITQKNIHET